MEGHTTTEGVIMFKEASLVIQLKNTPSTVVTIVTIIIIEKEKDLYDAHLFKIHEEQGGEKK